MHSQKPIPRMPIPDVFPGEHSIKVKREVKFGLPLTYITQCMNGSRRLAKEWSEIGKKD